MALVHRGTQVNWALTPSQASGVFTLLLHTHAHTQTDRQTDRQTHTHTQRESGSESDRLRQLPGCSGGGATAARLPRGSSPWEQLRVAPPRSSTAQPQRAAPQTRDLVTRGQHCAVSDPERIVLYHTEPSVLSPLHWRLRRGIGSILTTFWSSRVGQKTSPFCHCLSAPVSTAPGGINTSFH